MAIHDHDRWHKTALAAGEEPCAEHGKPPSARHGVGHRWQAAWTDAYGKRRSLATGSRRDAAECSRLMRDEAARVRAMWADLEAVLARAAADIRGGC
jgi:hypothetical protein